VCNGSPEVEDKSDTNEDSAPVPTTDDLGIVFLRSSIMTPVFMFFLSPKYSAVLLMRHAWNWTSTRFWDATNYHKVPTIALSSYG
jgi:hypothetical protein